MSLPELWWKILNLRTNKDQSRHAKAPSSENRGRSRLPRRHRRFESLEQRRFMAADLGCTPAADVVGFQDDGLVSDTILVDQTPPQALPPLWLDLNLPFAEPTQDPLEQAEKLGDPLETAEPSENPLEQAEKSADPLENAEPLGDPLDEATPLNDPLQNAEPLFNPLDVAEPVEDPLENAEKSEDPLEDAEPIDP